MAISSAIDCNSDNDEKDVSTSLVNEEVIADCCDWLFQTFLCIICCKFGKTKKIE
jgi:hypothetical protein